MIRECRHSGSLLHAQFDTLHSDSPLHWTNIIKTQSTADANDDAADYDDEYDELIASEREFADDRIIDDENTTTEIDLGAIIDRNDEMK